MGKNFSKNEVAAYERLSKMNQPMLKKAMGKFLRKNYKKVVETKEYVYAEGTIPVALVAHMDTVFKTQPQDIFYDREKNVMWSPDGLGADDRAGVFMIMSIIKAGFKPHIIFTTDEEIGGVGARELSKKPMPFNDLKYIIQLDRRGTNDCVFYDCDNRDFVEYVEKYGFIETWGTFTDISYLCPAWRVAGVNLSVGYNDEHSIAETLHVSAWRATFEKVLVMLSEEEIPFFKYVPFIYRVGAANSANWWNKYAFAYSDYYDYDEDEDGFCFPSEDDTYEACGFCNTIDNTKNLLYVKAIDGTMKPCCYDCLRENISWCERCDQPFEVDFTDPNDIAQFYCPDCKEKLNNGNN